MSLVEKGIATNSNRVLIQNEQSDEEVRQHGPSNTRHLDRLRLNDRNGYLPQSLEDPVEQSRRLSIQSAKKARGGT